MPECWSGNIGSFKTYSTDEADGLRLWEDVAERLARQGPPGLGERYGAPKIVQPRP